MTTNHASLTIAPLITLPVIEMDYLKYLPPPKLNSTKERIGKDVDPLEIQRLISTARRRGQQERQS